MYIATNVQCVEPSFYIVVYSSMRDNNKVRNKAHELNVTHSPFLASTRRRLGFFLIGWSSTNPFYLVIHRPLSNIQPISRGQKCVQTKEFGDVGRLKVPRCQQDVRIRRRCFCACSEYNSRSEYTTPTTLKKFDSFESDLFNESRLIHSCNALIL